MFSRGLGRTPVRYDAPHRQISGHRSGGAARAARGYFLDPGLRVRPTPNPAAEPKKLEPATVKIVDEKSHGSGLNRESTPTTAAPMTAAMTPLTIAPLSTPALLSLKGHLAWDVPRLMPRRSSS